MKGTEEQSAKALENWLRECDLTVTWQAVTPDPPDFLFTVGGERWAVEATELHQYIDKAGTEISRPGVEKPLERLCESIKAKANAGVNKTYLIDAMGPLLDVSAKEIENRAIAYISSGKTAREALDLQPIVESDPGIAAIKRGIAEDQAKVFIQALTTPVPIVWMTGLRGAALSADQEHLAADIDATLRYAIGRMLDDKLPKLAQLQGYKRKVLLVWKGYLFADPARVAELLTEKDLTVSDLDTVIFVTPDGKIHWVADPGQLFSCPGQNG